MCNQVLPLRFAVIDQRLCHLLCVVFPFGAQTGISFVAIFVLGGARTTEIGLPRLDMQIEQIKHNSLREIAKRALVHNDAFSGIDHLHIMKLALLDGLKVRYSRVDAFQVVSDGIFRGPAFVVGRADFDGANILLDDALVCACTFNEQRLHVVLLKFSCQRSTAGGEWIYGIVDSNLAVFVVEEVQDLLATLL